MCFDSLQIKVEKDLTLFEIKGQGVDEDPKGILQINRNTGEITVHGPVDYEKFKVLKVRRNLLKLHHYHDFLQSTEDVYVCMRVCVGVCGARWKVSYFTILAFRLQLVFLAFDKENHVLDTKLGVEIQILDSNDNTPQFAFERYEVSTKESTAQGNFLTISYCNLYCYYEMETLHEIKFGISQWPKMK